MSSLPVSLPLPRFSDPVVVLPAEHVQDVTQLHPMSPGSWTSMMSLLEFTEIRGVLCGNFVGAWQIVTTWARGVGVVRGRCDPEGCGVACCGGFRYFVRHESFHATQSPGVEGIVGSAVADMNTMDMYPLFAALPRANVELPLTSPVTLPEP